MNPSPRIIVSGLHRGENPQPGASIVRSIRRRYPDAFIVGLVYDAMESGIYVDGGPDVVYTMPYPTAGAQSYLQRLDQILAKSPADLFIPTLDAEIELLVCLEDDLRQRGLLTYMPDAGMLARRAKSNLSELAADCDVSVPETRPVYGVADAIKAATEFGYPVMVKGQYYDAKMAHNEADFVGAVTRLLAEWGAPAIVQRCIRGPEFNAMGIGDGEGGMIGLCCIRKTIISDKGKGLGGMTVHDKKLELMCRRLIDELQWRGPFEVEVMKDETTDEHCLIEINPRFPAWVDFPANFGANFAATLVEMMTTGVRPPTMPVCAPGNFYVRHQVEVHGHVSQLAELATSTDFDPAQETRRAPALRKPR